MNFLKRNGNLTFSSERCVCFGGGRKRERQTDRQKLGCFGGLIFRVVVDSTRLGSIDRARGVCVCVCVCVGGGGLP